MKEPIDTPTTSRASPTQKAPTKKGREPITGPYKLNCAMCQRNRCAQPDKTPDLARRGNYGTNFRHTVEFSKSGRAPSRPFQADRGQPEIRYPVGSAQSNTGSRPDLPTWSRFGRSHGSARRAWGKSDVCGAGPGSAFRPTRSARSRGPSNNYDISERIGPVQTPPATRTDRPQGAGGSAGSTSRAARRLPDVTTRPTTSPRGRS